jgi:hypothetical protein
MKLFTATVLSAALLAGASTTVQAQSLLGGILGGKNDSALVTLGSGDAGNRGLVNLGLGGDNQLLDAKIGNSGNIGRATVGAGGGSPLSADVDLLDGTGRVGLDVGGDGLLDLDVDIGGDGTGGDPGTGGGGGGVAAPGTIFFANGSSGMPSCEGVSASQLEDLILSTRVSSAWQRATNVDIQRVSVCPELREWLAASLAQTGLGSSIRSAIANDALLSASIQRSPYSADRVFAIDQNGSELVVFVY